MNKTIECELVEWDEVVSLTGKLAKQIHNAGFKPDIVIAIARGGFVPARLLCDYLDIYDLSCIRIAHYTGGPHKTEQARLTLPLNIDLTNLNVLLVDDVDDSGDTLQLAVEHIQGFSPAAVKIAVLHHKIVSKRIPDFFAKKQTHWRWITYPWAMIEDFKGFKQGLEPQPDTVQQAQQQIAEEYGVKPPLQTLEDIELFN